MSMYTETKTFRKISGASIPSLSILDPRGCHLAHLRKIETDPLGIIQVAAGKIPATIHGGKNRWENHPNKI